MKEGDGCGQYGADRILGLFFQNQKRGLLIDVGAADGYWNSNSIGLLKRPDWQGILIEPETEQFEKLQAKYKNREGATCIKCGIGMKEGMKTLHTYGQVSTFKEEVKKADEENRNIKYGTEQVMMRNLTNVLDELKIKRSIDFLSIDVEGMNREVWKTLDTKKYSSGLVCIEGRGHIMYGYKRFCTNGGNVFYLREDLCIIL